MNAVTFEFDLPQMAPAETGDLQCSGIGGQGTTKLWHLLAAQEYMMQLVAAKARMSHP